MSQIYYALVGAPNCGKTALFNALTGAHAKVANYPGVTVDRREGKLTGNPEVTIIDLPGTYSLRVTSPDEAVTRKVLLGELGSQPDAIIAVADATNLKMTLRMVLELKTLGLPMVVSLNLSDIARKRGSRVEAAKLAELLGVPVVETVATSHSGTEAIRKAVAMLPREPAPPLDAAAPADPARNSGPVSQLVAPPAPPLPVPRLLPPLPPHDVGPLPPAGVLLAAASAP